MKSLTIPHKALSSRKIKALLAKSNELEWRRMFFRAGLLAWWIKIRMTIHQLRYRSPAI